ncbi:MAG TPA: bifunctional phosphoribosylaminoimidazolecarboxamide formyltransferase/IMP cyclohydrolase [Clostridiaceae bacterium]|nr:bifunctional phosphoribosylaminoimidazolecarboxamide formyltransferase/IMP cyclohydrolase [Clostridiaceae bacterium]
MKRALISVSDKTGVDTFARQLMNLGYEIVSTGGTAVFLEQNGIPVVPVEEVTEFPECLDGRVKTLHPLIFGAILGRRDLPEHVEQMKLYNMRAIDLIAVNLYPFRKTILQKDKTRQECIEQIDIGGPSMLRAAAKNYQDVLVLCDPSDYERVIEKLRNDEADVNLRYELALKVFEHTAAYDAVIAEWLRNEAEAEGLELETGTNFTASYIHVAKLRYGENPQQEADYYRSAIPEPGSLTGAEQLSGKELSYNNISDTDAALALVREFEQACVVAVKHANPCGVGLGDTLLEAWDKAYASDPVSIFGGIIAANRTVEADLASKMNEIFLEVVVAPDFTAEALEILTQKPNLRLLKLPDLTSGKVQKRLKDILGGLLSQDEDNAPDDLKWQVPTEAKPDDSQREDLLFAMKVVKHVKSNAIVLVKDKGTVGIGAGQMNRVQAARIAIKQAGDKAKGSVLGSDAFFPFPDTVEEAYKAGVTAIIQPGGSIKDQDSIDFCNDKNLPMVITGVRHFRH